MRSVGRNRMAVEDLIERLRKDLPDVASVGGRVPTVLELSKRYCCASVTVNRAVHRLANEGVLIVRPRRGIYIAPANARRTRIEVGLLYWDYSNRLVQRLGLSVLISGLQTYLGSLNYNIRLLPFSNPDGIQIHQAVLSSGQIEYLIVDAPVPQEAARLIEGWGIKAIYIGSLPRDLGRAHVLYDLRHGCKAVFEHLYSAGHRRFGIFEILTDIYMPTPSSFVVASKEWLKEKGVSENDVRFCGYTHWPESSHNEAWKRLLEPPLPSAIVCAGDSSGIALITKLVEKGLRVPEDISVVIANNSLDFITPGFFTSLDLSQGLFDQGLAAGRILAQAVDTRAVPPLNKPIIVNPRLMVGRSVKQLS